MIPVVTAADMLAAVLAEAQTADALIMAAAVADFTPAYPAGEKIKKKSAPLSLDLAPTQDILLTVAQQKKDSGFPRVTVGFAAESEHLLENAAEKMVKKDLDLLVANDISRANSGFEVENNQVVFLERSGAQEVLPLLSKYEVAEKIIAKIAAQIG
jgi:phosphopantothenoylcysteine decarboxylase/phosphopantothenate--cysteine ligase